MADLSAIMQQIQGMYNPYYNQQLNGINDSYNQSSQADKDIYNEQLAEAKQTLAQVPQQYNGLRNSADITKNQAMSLLPSNLANSGAASDSGAAYAAATNIGNEYQKSMSSIGQEQDKAHQQAQNSINSLNANEAASQAKLNASKSSDYANAVYSQANNILSNALSQYSSQNSLEEQQREAAANQALEQQKLAEQQREYNQDYSEKRREYNQDYALNTAKIYGSSKSGSNSAKSLGTIAKYALSMPGSKKGSSVNWITAANNLNTLLDQYGVSDQSTRNQAFAEAGLSNYLQNSVSNVYNELSTVGKKYNWNSEAKTLMKQMLSNRYSEGDLGTGSQAAAYAAEIIKHYGL